MSETLCRECGGPVSTEAVICPRCGIPSPAKEPIPWGRVALWVVLLAALAVFVLTVAF